MVHMAQSSRPFAQAVTATPIWWLKSQAAAAHAPSAAGSSAELEAGTSCDRVQQLAAHLVKVLVGRQLEQVHARGGRGQPLARAGRQHAAAHLDAQLRLQVPAAGNAQQKKMQQGVMLVL